MGIMDIEHRLKILLQTPASSNNHQNTNLSSNSPNKAPFLKAWSISQNTKPEDLIQAATEELKITGAMDKIIEDQRKEQDSAEKILQSNSKTKTEQQNLTNFTVKKPINEMNPDELLKIVQMDVEKAKQMSDNNNNVSED